LVTFRYNIILCSFLVSKSPEIVYDLLEKNGLSRTYIPFDQAPERSTFVFSQPSKLLQSKKLLVLIHGSGLVNAGQWARRCVWSLNNLLSIFFHFHFLRPLRT